jgi:hypothetical protein
LSPVATILAQNAYYNDPEDTMLSNETEALVAQLDCSPEAKRRLRFLFQVYAGDLSKADACAELGIMAVEFDSMWDNAMQGMMDAMKEFDRSDIEE